MVNVIAPEINTIKEDISQTRLDQKTVITSVQACTDSLKESFDEMRKTKEAGTPITVCRKDDVNTSVRSEVNTAVREAMTGLDMTARISEESQTRLNEQINRMTERLKRSPLLTLTMNLSAKALAIILAIEVLVGGIAYFWFTNTPMYLGYELYQSSIRLNHRSPGQRYHFAYQATAAGRRKVVKAEIRNSLAKEKDYCAYTDTLRQVLADTTVFINGITYGKTEKIIDYTDKSGIIKSAYFRKDGAIRITDDQRMISLENARNMKGIRWKRVR